MITEQLQEQACLHVMGLLSTAEDSEFLAKLAGNTELQTLVGELHNATLALAAGVPRHSLPPEHRAKLMAALRETAAGSGNVIKRGPWLTALPWGIAACLTGLAAWQWTQLQDAEKLAKLTSTKLAASEIAQTETAQRLAAADKAIEQQRKTVADLQKQLVSSDEQRTLLADRLTKAEARDLLAQAQVAVLSSLVKEQPKAVAVSVWDQGKQNGVLVVENMPKLAPGKDYQLWVIDPSIAAPVSAGVFKVDEAGKVRIQFKPNQAVPTPGKFAVTIENEGGVASPTMDQMVVLGGF